MQKLLQQKGTDMSLDEITTKYQQVCVKAVEAAIRQVTANHDINELVDQGFYVATYLYDGTDLTICAEVGRDGYWGIERPETDVSAINEDLQLALDKLGLDVILNAMLTQDMECTEQVVFWELG